MGGVFPINSFNKYFRRIKIVANWSLILLFRSSGLPASSDIFQPAIWNDHQHDHHHGHLGGHPVGVVVKRSLRGSAAASHEAGARICDDRLTICLHVMLSPFGHLHNHHHHHHHHHHYHHCQHHHHHCQHHRHHHHLRLRGEEGGDVLGRPGRPHRSCNTPQRLILHKDNYWFPQKAIVIHLIWLLSGIEKASTTGLRR